MVVGQAGHEGGSCYDAIVTSLTLEDENKGQNAVTNVVRMVRPAETARSRNRSEALAVIIPRIRELLAKGSSGEIAGLPAMIAHKGDITITSVRLPGGKHFTIYEGQVRTMSGHLDPDPLGKYLDGTVHISSWKRGGWEAKLF